MKTYFKTRCIAIVNMAVGYGWAGGHYIPADSNLFAYLFQFVVIGILMWLSINFMVTADEGSSHWSIKGLGIFSSLSLVINILNVIHGAINRNTRSFGSHNTFSDLVPIAFLIVGSALWIFTIVAGRKAIIH